MAKSILYKDIHLDFKKHPVTGDLVVLDDEDSVKQSVRTLILTNVYERVMHPEKGSQISGALFELDTPATRILVQDTITSVLKQYEPRVSVKSILINAVENAYNVKITFSIIDFQRTATVNLLLQRTR